MKKPIRWTILIVVFGGMLALSVIFLLASTVPQNYQPYRMTQQERQQAAQHFVNVHGFDFFNKIQENKPFVHEMTADNLNMYLASLDEIAFLRPPKRGQKQRVGTVYEAMDKASLADPVVVIDDGLLTVMARTEGSNKVVSMDLRFEMIDRRMKVDVESVRIGRMPVPMTVVDGGIESLRQAVARRNALEEVTHKDFDALLGAVIAAIGAEPISTELNLRKKQSHRIKNIELDDGVMKLYVQPTGEPPAPDEEYVEPENIDLEPDTTYDSE